MLKQGCRGYKKRQRRAIKDDDDGAALHFAALQQERERESCRMARVVWIFIFNSPRLHVCWCAREMYMEYGVFCCAVIIIISSSYIIKGTRREYYHPPKLQINSSERGGVTSSGPRVVAMATAPSLSLSRAHTLFPAPLSITRQHQVRASFLPNKVERINFSCRQLGARKNVDNAAIKSESIPAPQPKYSNFQPPPSKSSRRSSPDAWKCYPAKSMTYYDHMHRNELTTLSLYPHPVKTYKQT
jgi:hypothetical protein